MSTGQRTRLKRLVNHHTGISLRKVSRKFDVHRRTIERELNRMEIQYRKKKKAHSYAPKQLQEVPMRAGRLYRTLISSDVELIMDEETFFTLINESVSANRGFYTTKSDVSSAEVTFKRTQRYSAKVMVWIALSEKGISGTFFTKHHQPIYDERYLKHCIKGILLPFINRYHDPIKVLFWIDLTWSHYASSVIDFWTSKESNRCQNRNIRREGLRRRARGQNNWPVGKENTHNTKRSEHDFYASHVFVDTKANSKNSRR